MIHPLFVAGAARQMAQSNRAQITSELASHKATTARRKTEQMQFDLEKLFIITEALWTILKDRFGYTEEDLMQLIEDIDLQDGRRDGKKARSADRPKCPDCGRTIIRRQVVCLYCGAEAPQKPFKR